MTKLDQKKLGEIVGRAPACPEASGRAMLRAASGLGENPYRTATQTFKVNGTFFEGAAAFKSIAPWPRPAERPAALPRRSRVGRTPSGSSVKFCRTGFQLRSTTVGRLLQGFARFYDTGGNYVSVRRAQGGGIYSSQWPATGPAVAAGQRHLRADDVSPMFLEWGSPATDPGMPAAFYQTNFVTDCTRGELFRVTPTGSLNPLPPVGALEADLVRRLDRLPLRRGHDDRGVLRRAERPAQPGQALSACARRRRG